ncbi:MAG: sugar transferase [Anaerolineales bacterium]|jgi:lipopolysaccharide/colanic/teichoic acid biosynthesis glycosyltransferase|nr:sugar transferase [Anaerolineales bacterium]
MISDTMSKANPINYARPRPWHTRLAKRALDIFGSLLGLLLLWPLFLLIAIIIKRDSPGPVLFRGPRMGLGGRVFHILKFRTMREDPASYAGPKITANGDGRITPLGRWLRDTKLNELPQLWNVLVGEMSLVGPRPEDPELAARWPADVRRELLAVRPGITSPASISYHDEEKQLSPDNLMGDYLEKIAPDKIRLDRLYVRHYNLMTDLDAIFWTLIVLVPRVSIQPKSEGQLFGGPFTRLVRPLMNWTVIDFVIALFGAGAVGLTWRIFEPLDIGWIWAAWIGLGIALLFSLFNSLLGLNRVEWSRATAEDAAGILLSAGLVIATCTALDMFIPEFTFPNGYIITAGFLIAVGFLIARYRLRLLTGLASRWVNLRGTGFGTGERVLVIGAGAGGEIVTWLLRRPDFKRLFTVHGYVDDVPTKQGMRYDGLPVLGTTADLPDLVAREDIGLLVYAIEKISAGDRERILKTCRQTEARLVILSDVLQSFQAHLGQADHKGKKHD